MSMPGGSELLLIFLIVVLLFGAQKIPELAKGVGKGIRNFKREMRDDETPETPKPIETTKASEATPSSHSTKQV